MVEHVWEDVDDGVAVDEAPPAEPTDPRGCTTATALSKFLALRLVYGRGPSGSAS